MPITSRPYADETDYERMRALLRTIVSLSGVPTYCTVGDLDWGRFTEEDPDAVHTAQLWFNGDHVVAIAWPDGTQIDLMTHPEHRALDNEMLQWAEARHAAGTEATEPFAAWGFDQDHARTTVFQQRGYTRTDKHYEVRARNVPDLLLQPALPPGFTIRHVAREADLEPRVEVHRAAFAPSRMTAAKHRAVMHAPTYRADLDLIVTALDGRFAAFCIVWLDDANRVGVFEPVGCAPDFQRRGLAKAVMIEGLRRLQALGATTACVLNWHGEIAPAKLYDGLGFRERDRNYQWQKQVSPGS